MSKLVATPPVALPHEFDINYNLQMFSLNISIFDNTFTK